MSDVMEVYETNSLSHNNNMVSQSFSQSVSQTSLSSLSQEQCKQTVKKQVGGGGRVGESSYSPIVGWSVGRSDNHLVQLVSKYVSQTASEQAGGKMRAGFPTFTWSLGRSMDSSLWQLHS